MVHFLLLILQFSTFKIILSDIFTRYIYFLVIFLCLLSNLTDSPRRTLPNVLMFSVNVLRASFTLKHYFGSAPSFFSPYLTDSLKFFFLFPYYTWYPVQSFKFASFFDSLLSYISILIRFKNYF